MKEEWLFRGALVPVDVETTAALAAEIKRLIDVVGGMALAQPEQEPVAWISTGPARMIYWESDKPAFGDDWVPLYTTPPQRKPLNWEPIQEFWRNNSNIDWDELGSAIKQAAHGIKENT